MGAAFNDINKLALKEAKNQKKLNLFFTANLTVR
jgi:hypothetical protein